MKGHGIFHSHVVITYDGLVRGHVGLEGSPLGCGEGLLYMYI
jgi:hypothetical protein